MVRKQHNSQVVLLTREQVEKLQRLQAMERERSEFGITPSIHEVARKLVDKALTGVDL